MTADARVVLNETTQGWIARIAELGRPHFDDLAEERSYRLIESDQLSAGFVEPIREGISVREHSVTQHSVFVRELRPTGFAEPLPAYLLLHGGAFWHGSAEEDVNMSLGAFRALETGAAVFLADYRLAPEFPCPAAIEDVVGILQWLRSEADALGIDPGRIVLGGVSAGASIATAATGRVKTEGLVSGLLLEVPAVDLRPDGSWDERFAPINGLDSAEGMVGFYSAGLPADHPDISPVLIDVEGFPPTHIMTAEYDPLRGGGEILATRLREAGIPVTATRHLGALHGSIGLTGVDPIAIAWQDEVCCALRRLFKN